jgi:two-component system, response regulator
VATEGIEILLVEDNPADVELTLYSLRHNNLADRIQVVRDGEEALDYLFGRGAHVNRVSERSLKLVLLDLKLPKVDGLEVLRGIKSDSRTKIIPVVVLTSSKEEKDMVSSYNLGVNSYIQKPVDFEHFRETIKQLGIYWLVVNQPLPAEALFGEVAGRIG